MISPDNQRVVYLADQDTAGVSELYSVPITGGETIKLNEPSTGGGCIMYYQISPNSQYVVYHGDCRTNDTHELFYAPIAGGPVTVVNDPLVAGGDVLGIYGTYVVSYRISADSQYVVYMADQETDERPELYCRSVQDWSIAKLSQPADTFPDQVEKVNTFQIVPNSHRVIYTATSTAYGTTLYGVPIDADGWMRTVLNIPAVSGGDVAKFQISPDSNHVAYMGDLETDGQVELYAAFDIYNVYLPLTVR
jgi:hypothetical protein